jgi:uncharacterized protein
MAETQVRMGEGDAISVLLVYSPAPRQVHERVLNLPVGASVGDALHALARHAAAEQDNRFVCLPPDVRCGVWNRCVLPSHTLAEGDRIELYRPLRVDPKVARRERFKKQGAKSAGLFATRRPGAKAGY